MTGIVIVTHGEMATGLMDSLSLIMGEHGRLSNAWIKAWG